jgi:hypothetical protein
LDILLTHEKKFAHHRSPRPGRAMAVMSNRSGKGIGSPPSVKDCATYTPKSRSHV